MKTVTKTSIRRNLRALDALYAGSSKPQKSLFYAKLAILEMCGWIEETMDRVVRACSRRTICDPHNRKFIEDTAIRRTHGFDYTDHFRRMLIQVIGLHGVEIIEGRADPTKLQALKSTLGALKSRRDAEAHTHLIATTRTIDAPSVTLHNFQTVYDGLVEIDRVLKKAGF